MQVLLDSSGRLDPTACQRARLARDPRFDGEFFVGVTSTGIFCRPVCPARLPAERNVRYFRHAAQAADAGFRPCLRCRPEAAPHSPAWQGSATTVQRALRLIGEGALDGDGSVAALARRLGVGSRYLHKLFRRELGVAPSAVAKTQRLLLARQLIVESSLPLTEIAWAAGFGSVRRFNSAIREAFGTAPGALRRGRAAPAGGDIALELHYRPPYDWPGVLAFFERHAVDGVERIADGGYERNLRIGSGAGRLRVDHVPARQALRVQLDVPAGTALLPLVNRVRGLCDLDANPAAISAVLGADPLLAPLLKRRPGIRSPGHWSPGEAAVRAVVGQQISTAAARRICAAFATACTFTVDESASVTFPEPAALLALDDSQFPMPRRRRETLRSLGALCRDDADACREEAVAALSGVGPWTTAMLGLRGWGNPDAFPAGDLGLRQAWAALGGDGKDLARHAESWRPYRGYAASLLWRTL
jgi:AraC family transcriptional regulator of adaptative response / DNA-3-methyladenine glycosylase II